MRVIKSSRLFESILSKFWFCLQYWSKYLMRGNIDWVVWLVAESAPGPVLFFMFGPASRAFFSCSSLSIALELAPYWMIFSWFSSSSDSVLRQNMARMFISRSSIMRPISHRQHVVSIISALSLRHRIKLMKIFVISFKVSRSMSFDLRQEIMIVFKHSYSMILLRISSLSDRREKHLQASW